MFPKPDFLLLNLTLKQYYLSGTRPSSTRKSQKHTLILMKYNLGPNENFCEQERRLKCHPESIKQCVA